MTIDNTYKIFTWKWQLLFSNGHLILIKKYKNHISFKYSTISTYHFSLNNNLHVHRNCYMSLFKKKSGVVVSEEKATIIMKMLLLLHYNNNEGKSINFIVTEKYN